MRPWVTAGVCLCLVVAGAALWEYRRLRDRCGQEDVSSLIVRHVNDGRPGDGLVISNPHLSAGQFFSFPYQCEADVIALTGNVDLSTKPRRHLRFEVSHSGQETSLRFID